MGRYGVLLAVVLVVGVLLALAGRRPHERRAAEQPSAPQRTVTVSLTILDTGIDPVHASVSGGSQVTLTIENHTARPARVALAGYEDRLPIGTLSPHARWTGTFLADRPGDDFAWSVNGAPAGRFEVAGSHLIEGHR